MSTRAIKKKRGGDDPLSEWESTPEFAPSMVRADQPMFSRYFAVLGLICICVGGLAVLAPIMGMNYLVSQGWGIFLLSVGFCVLLYHAFTDKDVQYRRLYGLLGAVLIAAGVVLRFLPTARQGLGGMFLPYGAPALVGALLFLLVFVRNETDEWVRQRGLMAIGIIGVLNAGAGFIGGFLNQNFLLGQGIVHLILGLVYLWGYIGVEGGARSDRGYYAGWGLAIAGSAAAVLSLVISFGPQLGLWRAPATDFFVPRGLLLLYMGVEYALLGLSISCDWRIVVLTKRDVQAYFFSPIAYIVLIGLTIVGWFTFLLFLNKIIAPGAQPSPVPEPIFRYFVIDLVPIICLIFMVPVLTMRLLSEEKRTSTLEVLLTAPVNETTVVLAKFLAALRFYLLCWYSWGLFLVALYIEGGQSFDYRPVLTFFVSLSVYGAGFLAMGIFFSSVTSNQVAAAILTFAGMMAWTAVFFVPENSSWHGIFSYVSYINVWIESSNGVLQPRKLLFHASTAVFWLFLTVKVLESRKWS